jgi:AbrB family looped-hinge helix DNA binding protein
MNEIKTKIGAGGRIVIPAEFRRTLRLKPGDEVILALEGEEVRVLTPERAIRRAQALVRRYVPKGRSLVDELIRERRDEAARA